MNELILVVERSLIDRFIVKNYGFIRPHDDTLYKAILSSHEFIERGPAETNYTYKQIIPYVILTNQNNILLVQRKNKQNENRLHNKYSIGIGGHINPSLTVDTDIVVHGLFKELHEEVKLGKYNYPEFIGYINDDISDVGKVHLGLLYRIEVNDHEIELLETDKMEGDWASREKISSIFTNLESWSQIAFNAFYNIENENE